MTKISAIDHVLLLAAKNYNGQSMVQAAKKGASQGALDQAAKIFCDNVVGKARAEYQKMINDRHDKTTASFTLSKGADYLKELSQNGLSQEMKDYILLEYLSVGILGDAQEVAEFGASSKALGELRKALIEEGEPRGLDKIVALQGVPLCIREIDALVNVCVKKHMTYNAHILVEAIDLGASDRAREHAAREFIKERKVCRWDVLLQILGDCESGPQEVLDKALMMVIEDIHTVITDRGLSVRRYSDQAVSVVVGQGVELVKRGPSPYVSDFFVQDLIARKIWSIEDIWPVAHRCSKMFIESLVRELLDKARAKRLRVQTGSRYDNWADLLVMMKKLAQIAVYANDLQKHDLLKELLECNLGDEAVELSSCMER
jgi:hypothetical protein